MDRTELTGRRAAPEPSAVFAILVVGMAGTLPILDPSGPLGGWAFGAPIGGALLVGGVALHAAAWRHFHRIRTTVATLDSPSRLVEDGVFGVTRNPMYLGGALILTGWAVLLGHAALLAVTLLWIPTAELLWIRPEERLLRGHFGEAWLAYRRRVRRWI